MFCLMARYECLRNVIIEDFEANIKYDELWICLMKCMKKLIDWLLFLVLKVILVFQKFFLWRNFKLFNLKNIFRLYN